MKKKALLGFKLLLGRTSSSSQKQRRQQHPGTRSPAMLCASYSMQLLPQNKGWSCCHPGFTSVFVFLSSVQC